MEDLIKKTQLILDLTEQLSSPIYAKLTKYGSAPKPERRILSELKTIQGHLIELLFDLGCNYDGFYEAEINAIYRKYVLYNYMGRPTPTIKTLAQYINKPTSVVSRMINKTRKKLLEEGVIIEEDRRACNLSNIDPDLFCRNFIAKAKYGIKETRSRLLSDLQSGTNGSDGIHRT